PLDGDSDTTVADGGEKFLQAWHVQVIVQALAEGLCHDGEIRMAAGDLQQVSASQSLQPQRCPPPCPTPRQPQRPGRILSETQREKRAVGQFRQNQLFDVFRRQAVEQVQYRLVTIGQADQQAVVVMETLWSVT